MKHLVKDLRYTEIAGSLWINKVTVSRALNRTTMKPHTVQLLADFPGVEMRTIVK
jgi:hypothetical protein